MRGIVGDRIIAEMVIAQGKGEAPLEAFMQATANNDPDGRVRMALAFQLHSQSEISKRCG